jgi:hypothetical protein
MEPAHDSSGGDIRKLSSEEARQPDAGILTLLRPISDVDDAAHNGDTGRCGGETPGDIRFEERGVDKIGSAVPHQTDRSTNPRPATPRTG